MIKIQRYQGNSSKNKVKVAIQIDKFELKAKSINWVEEDNSY